MRGAIDLRLALVAKRASQGRKPFSSHREHGTLLSQRVFALAQLIQEIGVRSATVVWLEVNPPAPVSDSDVEGRSV